MGMAFQIQRLGHLGQVAGGGVVGGAIAPFFGGGLPGSNGLAQGESGLSSAFVGHAQGQFFDGGDFGRGLGVLVVVERFVQGLYGNGHVRRI